MAPITARPSLIGGQIWTASRASEQAANKQTPGNHLSWQELSSSDLALKTETHNVILVIEKGGGGMEGERMAGKRGELDPHKWQTCHKFIYCRGVRRASLVHLWALPATTAAFVHPSPLRHARHAAFGATKITEPDSAAGREKRKNCLSAVFIVLLMLAWISVLMISISLWSFLPLPLWIVCYFPSVFGSQW